MGWKDHNVKDDSGGSFLHRDNRANPLASKRDSRDMSHTRRSFLIGSSITITAVAGCQKLAFEDQSQIDLAIANYTERIQPLKLTLLRGDESGAEDPVELDKEYTVPAPESDSESAGSIFKTDVAPKRPYLVRVQLKYGGLERSHAHYYPSESPEDRIGLMIRRDEKTDELFVDYRSLA